MIGLSVALLFQADGMRLMQNTNANETGDYPLCPKGVFKYCQQSMMRDGGVACVASAGVAPAHGKDVQCVRKENAVAYTCPKHLSVKCQARRIQTEATATAVKTACANSDTVPALKILYGPYGVIAAPSIVPWSGEGSCGQDDNGCAECYVRCTSDGDNDEARGVFSNIEAIELSEADAQMVSSMTGVALRSWEGFRPMHGFSAKVQFPNRTGPPSYASCPTGTLTIRMYNWDGDAFVTFDSAKMIWLWTYAN